MNFSSTFNVSTIAFNTTEKSTVPLRDINNNPEDKLRMAYGIFLVIVCSCVLFLATLVIIAIHKSGNLSKNALYVLATYSLLNSMVILLILGWYTGSQLILRSPIPDTKTMGPINRHVGQILQASIFAGSIFQTIIAVNRLLAFRNTQKILSHRTYVFIGIGVFLLALCLSYGSTYLLPCCKIYMSFISYGFEHNIFIIQIGESSLAAGFPYGEKYVNMPVYVITTIIPILCYTYIFGYSILTRRKLINHNKAQKRAEIILAIQFATIFFFYACYWIYEQIIAQIIPYIPLIAALKTLFLMLEATMNTIINASIKEVRETLKRFVTWKFYVADSNNNNNHVVKVSNIVVHK